MSVRQRATDSSGRPIYASDYLWALWLRILTDDRVTPFATKLVVVQGSWMSKVKGGGATTSAGFHDRGGCFDVRTRDLTRTQIDTFILVAREYGWAFWRRDKTPAHGGMDPHAHGVCGADDDLAPGAARQWQSYLDGRDGLASDGPDYEARPNPLVTTPPTEDEDMTPAQETLLKNTAAGVDRLESSLIEFRRAVNIRFKAAQVRDLTLIRQGIKDGKTDDQLVEMLTELTEKESK